MVEAAGADRAQVMDPDHALAQVGLQHLQQTIEERGVLLVEEPRGGLADQADTRSTCRLSATTAATTGSSQAIR